VSGTDTASQVPAIRPQSPRTIPTPQPGAAPKDPAARVQPANKGEPQVNAPTTIPPVADQETSESSSDSSDSEDENIGRRRPPFKRFGKFSVHRPSRKAEDDEDDDSPAFLPLSRPDELTTQRISRDPSATLRQEPRRQVTQLLSAAERVPALHRIPATESSASSASSGIAENLPAKNGPRSARQAGTVSPRRTAEMARLSPRQRGGGREGSEGTPSMGSSFSDLDGTYSPRWPDPP
jgi:hypothetical protein